MTVGTFNDFLDALGYQESTNDYSKENESGYLGRYQFGESALFSSNDWLFGIILAGCICLLAFSRDFNSSRSPKSKMERSSVLALK